MAGRAQAAWTPSDTLDFNLKIEGQRSRSEMGQGEFFGLLPNAAFPTVPCPGNPQCTDFFGYFDNDGDPFTGDWSGDHFYDIDQWGATLRADADLGERDADLGHRLRLVRPRLLHRHRRHARPPNRLPTKRKRQPNLAGTASRGLRKKISSTGSSAASSRTTT